MSCETVIKGSQDF